MHFFHLIVFLVQKKVVIFAPSQAASAWSLGQPGHLRISQDITVVHPAVFSCLVGWGQAVDIFGTVRVLMFLKRA